MIKTKLNLTDYQLKKIKDGWKNQKTAGIRLCYEQISGTSKYKLLLTEAQKEKLDKSKKIKKWLL